MFIHETHLPQVLRPEHYRSPEHHRRERERLFLPGWHLVGAMSDLPQDGDYFTHELLGHPLITWRHGDEAHTFNNVCAHRFSLLSDKPCGRMPGRVRCQYHGWEYDESGTTCKIPDARSFRPMEKGQLGLVRHRTERAGQLLFVTLSEDAPSLADYLGPIFPMAEQWFSERHVPVITKDSTYECDWKVIVENFLEAYHIECLHPTTFREYPAEEECTHEFHDTWDHYRHDYSSRGNRGERFISWMADVEPAYTWQHLLRYPSVVFGVMALFTFAQTITPIGPGRCRMVFRTFVHPGRRSRPVRWLVGKLLAAWGNRFFDKVTDEDGAIFPVVQRGMSSPVLPGKGLVSRREERIFPFQKYVLQATGGTAAALPAVQGNGQCLESHETCEPHETRESRETETHDSRPSST